jgi:hypothetical protein
MESPDDVVLSGSAVPLSEMEVAVRFMDDALHRFQQLCDFAVSAASVAVPPALVQV